VLDMRRFGMQAIQRELLCDLLELGSLSPPTRVTDNYQRSRLLLELLSEFPESLLGPAALQEARSLESSFASPEYSFHVARAEATLHTRCDRALPALKRMLKSAWQSRDIHRIAEGKRAIAGYYGERGEHARARRWYWLTINTLCMMKEICPHCLGSAFLGAGGESLNCHDCETTDDRLLKAFLIGEIIPDRRMQFTALLKLSGHLAAHRAVDEAVACAVLAARLGKETWTEDEEMGLPAMLAELIANCGREAIADSLARVEAAGAATFVAKLVSLYKLNGFTKSLDLKPSSAGDHW